MERRRLALLARDLEQSRAHNAWLQNVASDQADALASAHRQLLIAERFIPVGRYAEYQARRSA